MANMGYCRFENTAIDLRDCVENWDETPRSETEKRGRLRILKLAAEIFDNCGIEYDLDDFDTALKDYAP